MIEGGFETYRASADAKIAPALTPSPYTIEVRFLEGLTDAQKDAFKAAADRWCRMVVGALPAVEVGDEIIQNVLILAQGKKIDGPGKILGQAGPTHLRPGNAGAAAFLPAKGIMSFDVDDLSQMEQKGTLADVITHEMGHVIGIGTIWSTKNLLQDSGTSNPIFSGTAAMDEFSRMKGAGGGGTPVPVENRYGPGTQDSHWREAVFLNELMTGFISEELPNPLSRLTVASLQDLGYTVSLDSAEPYELPDLQMVAEQGLIVSNEARIAQGVMLPSIPVTLPENSLR